MNDRDWEILTILYEKKNITQAAKKLHISQPALTFRLQQIEDEFGVKVAHRSRKGVEFTAQGEDLVRYAEEMLVRLRKTREHLWSMTGSAKGVLRLGVAGVFAYCMLPAILREFNSQYPAIEFNVTTGWSAEILNLLFKQDAHVGIIRGDYSWPDQKKLLMEEPLLIVSKTKIDPDKLPHLPRIDYKTDGTLKNIIDNWWLETYAQAPSITMHVDRLETCRELVRNGLGYAILPGLVMRNNKDFFTMKLVSKNNVPVIRRTWLMYRKESLEIPIVRIFIDFLKDYNYH
jgi:DNA-binding transcriptional LysR family regulator